MKSNSTLLLIFKVLSMFAFVFFTNQGFDDRITVLLEDKNHITLVVFFILWCITFLILLSVSFQQKFIIRLFWGIIIALTSSISYGFYAAGGSELEVLDVFELWQARHETGRALSHFSNAAIKGALVALFGLLIIIYPPPRFNQKASKVFSLLFWLPLVPLFLFSSLIFVKSDKAVAGLPQQFSPASMAFAIAYKSAIYKMPEREVVTDTPIHKAKSKHLLYLVDESINPKYIYSEDGKLLKGFDDNNDKIANFGVAISGSNCSARSNAIMRLGATRNNLIQSVKTKPSIWQYAKNAGFRTVYIDAQASGIVSTKPNNFQNYMTTKEASFIDKFYKVKDVKAPMLDYRLLELVKKELESDIPTFIYANKNGAHFPYADNYPESEAIFQPVENTTINKVIGQKDSFGRERNLEVVVNSYMNSIHWTVDKFFQQFFKDLDLNDTSVIYTADHGQYFAVDRTTHCTSGDGAPAEEGTVPLMFMSADQKLLSEFNQAAETNFNKTDHFSIFPTVLNLLGYSKSVQNEFGPSLLEPQKEQISAFNTGDILGIISNDTIWRKVTLEERTAN